VVQLDDVAGLAERGKARRTDGFPTQAEASASEGFRRLFVRLFAASAGGPGVGEMWVDILSGLRVPASEEDGGREEKSAVEDDLFAPSESVL
jgi:hypothetical protein